MNIEKIIINNGIIKYGKLTWNFSNNEEIKNILNVIFMGNVYNDIHVYKRVPGKRKYLTKVCIFYDKSGKNDLVIVCDKSYLSAVKEALINLELEYSKPTGGLNKKELK